MQPAQDSNQHLMLLYRLAQDFNAAFDPSVMLTQRAVSLEAGDVILFYTDGVTDALDDAGREFGEDCLRQLAVAHRGDSAMGMVGAIEAALKAHIGGTPPFDDITLMALKRL